MTENTRPEAGTQNEIRASDAERERVVALLQHAGAEGRLTLDEVDERVATAFAATYRSQLPPLTRDLPHDPPADSPAPKRPAGFTAPNGIVVSRGIAIHAIIATVLSVMLIGRWAAGPTMFFWPAFPMLWLWGSLAIRIVLRRSGVWRDARWGNR